MRNRVTHQAARVARLARTASVLALLPAAVLVVAAQSALAETSLAEGLAVDDRLPFTMAGPVGIAAVLVGVGGLVAGLLRRRRLTAARSAPRAVPGTAPAPAATGVRRPSAASARGGRAA